MPISTQVCAGKRPILHRCFGPQHLALLVTLAIALPAPTLAAATARPLTEADSVRLALARPDLEALTAGRVALARSEVTAAGLLANPEIEYAWEQLDRPTGDATEQAVWLSQRFELSGRRGLRQDAAEHRVEAASLGGAAARVDAAAEARTRFFRVLQQQQRLVAIAAWTRRLETTGEVVRKRQAAGEVSGYDALRVARELSSAEATLSKEQAGYRRLWAELSAQLGGADVVDGYGGVTGELLPEPPPSVETLLAAVARRPDIERLAREAAAHDLERRAGQRGWVPELTLGMGRKTVDDDLGTDSGPMIGAGLSVPLFDRGQAETQRAAAAATVARSEHRLALARAEGELRGLWQEVSALTGPGWTQQRAARDQAARLIGIAEAAYRGGEIGVLELLDAYRGAHEAELQALEMAAAARQARIELDRLTGGLEP